MLECFSEQHRRPRWNLHRAFFLKQLVQEKKYSIRAKFRFAGPVDSPSSAIGMLDVLAAQFSHSTLQFKMVSNVSNCTCAQHRCNVPLPPFSIVIRWENIKKKLCTHSKKWINYNHHLAAFYIKFSLMQFIDDNKPRWLMLVMHICILSMILSRNK